MEPLDQPNRGRSALVAALRETVVHIAVGESSGTGFYVSNGHILTAAHVLGTSVQAGDSIEISIDGELRQLTVEAMRPNHPRLGTVDIAVVATPTADAWAYVSEEFEPGDDVFVYGHPAGPYSGGDSLSLRVEGPSFRRDIEPYVRLSGSRATEGFSGSAVLNWRTGAVCGLLARANESSARAIPISIILELFPELEQRKNGFDTPVGWLDLLDEEQLNAAGSRFVAKRLEQYLSAIRTVASQHPYGASLPHPPKLSEVYLTQDLVPNEGSGHGWPAADDQVNALHSAPDPSDAVTATELLKSRAGAAIIFGDPGAGKSSLLRDLAQDVASGWIAGRDDVDAGVPVLIDAASLTAAAPLHEAVAAGVAKTCGALLMDARLEELFSKPPLRGVDWVLLVDGLDEIASPTERRRVIQIVENISSGSTAFRCLVTSRRLGSTEMVVVEESGLLSLHIQPFTTSQLPVLAERWFRALGLSNPTALRGDYFNALVRSRLLPLAKLPLIATMLCVVYADDPTSPLPSSRSQLYAKFVDALTGKRFVQIDALTELRKLTTNFGAATELAVEHLQSEIVPVLSRLAYRLCVNPESVKPDDLVDQVIRDVGDQRPDIVPVGRWREIVTEIVRQSGLVAWRGDRHDFIHLTIAEYLGAIHDIKSREDPPLAHDLLRDVGSESFQEFRALTAIDQNPAISEEIAAALLGSRLAGALRLAHLVRAGLQLTPTHKSRALRALASARAPYWVSTEEVAEAMAWIDLDFALDHLVRTAGHQAARSEFILLLRAILRADQVSGFECLSDLADDWRIHHSVRDWLAQEFVSRMSALPPSALVEMATDGRLSGWFRVRALAHLTMDEVRTNAESLAQAFENATLSPTQRRLFGANLVRANVLDLTMFLKLCVLGSASSPTDAIAAGLFAARFNSADASQALFEVAANLDWQTKSSIAYILMPTESDLGERLLREVAEAGNASASARGAATIQLARLSDDSTEFLLRASPLTVEERFILLAELLLLKPEAAMVGLKEIAGDPSTGTWRVQAIRALAGAGQHVPSEELVALATDMSLPTSDRLYCARRIVPQERTRRVAAYASLFPTVPIMNTTERFEIAVEFLEVAGIDAVASVVSVVEDRRVAPFFRFQLGLRIANLSARHGSHVLAHLAADQTMDDEARPSQALFSAEGRLVPARHSTYYASYRLLCARQLHLFDADRGVEALLELEHEGTFAAQAREALEFLSDEDN